MLIIDGSFGEGGGQILRTALGLSLVTSTPFRIEKIRARRAKPGLMRQHLTAVSAAAQVGQAEVAGAFIGGMELTFIPGKVVPGNYSFSVGTAGSATLVLQTVLPALLTAAQPSVLVLEGGTHNPHAPPFDFLAKAFLPLVNRMGPKVTATLLRPGFYPAGGGQLTVALEPAAQLTSFDLLARGEIVGRRARAMVARLPRHIAERELDVIAQKMSWDRTCLHVETVEDARGPGNVVIIEIESQHVAEVFTGFGERGVRAETVADHAAQAALRYLGAGVPVGEHLADQLIVPMALAGRGSFVTLEPTPHATTNMEVLRQFLGVEIKASSVAASAWRIEIHPRKG
jgi:RNA 3'-terminal phosphate cyclase (ATP)